MCTDTHQPNTCTHSPPSLKIPKLIAIYPQKVHPMLPTELIPLHTHKNVHPPTPIKLLVSVDSLHP